MVQYLILCITSVLCGMGILRIFKFTLSGPLLIYLAPVITFSFWAIFLGTAVALDFPIKNVWVLGWALTFLLSVAGLCQESIISIFKKNDYKKIFSSHRQEYLIFILIIILPMIMMLPHFWHGLANYAGSYFPDGWAYMALGQSLWEYPNGTDGQLAPLHQYAAVLSDSRFIAASLLSFFSPLFGVPGDTQTAANLLISWSFFNLLSACAFFAHTEKLGKFIPLYLILVIFSGILLKLLFANNFDNALILCVLPVYAGITHLIHHQPFKWGVILSIITAASVYTYIEMTTVIVLCAFILFIPFLYKFFKENKISAFILILLVTAVTVILSLPYLADSIDFVLKQFNHATHSSTGRPGEGIFPDLVAGIDFIPTFWGVNPNFLGFLLGAILTSLLIMGFVFLFKNRKFSYISVCSLLFVGTGVMLFHQHYDYGVYKLLLLNWWLIAFIITFAICRLISQNKIKIWFNIFIMSSGLGYFAVLYGSFCFFEKTRVPIEDIYFFKKIVQIKEITQGKAVYINVNDWAANHWAVYFLRDIPIKLSAYSGYMSHPHAIPYMHRSKVIDSNEIDYELTDNPQSFSEDKLIWKNGPYYLWEAPN